MRPYLLIAALAIVTWLDAWSTVYLYQNVPGRELNPFIDPSSFAGIIFSPIKFLVYVVFLVCVIHSELNARIIADSAGPPSLTVLAAYLPLYLIFLKSLAILNNLMAIAGFSTPISYLLMVMEPLISNLDVRYQIFHSLLIVACYPAGALVLKKVYGTSGRRL